MSLRHSRAGEGNRTLTTSLEGWGSAIELHPLFTYSPILALQHASFQTDLSSDVLSGGNRIRTCEGMSQQIYSLSRLTASVSPQVFTAITFLPQSAEAG